MLIEDLIRLGRPLLNAEMRPEELLRLLTDVADPRAKNFYRHVFVVVLPTDKHDEPRALAVQEFGQDQDGDFEVDLVRATAAPLVLPSGGNPLHPQGHYGMPVYPCYHRHLQDFRQSAEHVLRFLRARLERTAGWELAEPTLRQVGHAVHRRVASTDFGKTSKILGLLVLARCGRNSGCRRGDPWQADRIAPPERGQAIVPVYSRMLDSIWSARLEEGRQAGVRTGPCSFSNDPGEVVSAYCKAWPWAFPTWNCPLPKGGNAEMLVQSIGVSSATYRALTLGACVFNRLMRRVRPPVVSELLSPAQTRAGKDQAQRRAFSDLPAVHGAAIPLPVHESSLTGPAERNGFLRGIRALLAAAAKPTSPPEPNFGDVVGFDCFLPTELAGDEYRLNLLYFSGEYGRGEVCLRAAIRDVSPRALLELRQQSLEYGPVALALLEKLLPALSESQRAYLGHCYRSVPYLLARAYGGAYLWQQLDALLHRQPLDPRRVTANAARRLQSLLPHWPASRWAVTEEVGFYLGFLEFLIRANEHHRRASGPGGPAMPLGHWEEKLRAFRQVTTEAMRFDSVTELGFACGLLVRRFSGWYSYRLGSHRDFLKDRALTVASRLSPRDVCRVLRTITELAQKFSALGNDLQRGQLAYEVEPRHQKPAGDFARRLGVVQAELPQQSAMLESSPDEFMVGFWIGYCLQGSDRPRKPKDEGQPEGQPQARTVLTPIRE
jgi:hypothetical protein